MSSFGESPSIGAAGGGEVDHIWVSVDALIGPAETNLKRIEGQTARTTKRMGDDAEKGSKRFASSMEKSARAMEANSRRIQAAGRPLTKMFTLPLLAVGAAAVKMNVDFEREMRKVQTQAGASATQLKQLEKAALSLARNGPSGPKAVAEAMYHAQSLLAGMPNSVGRATALVRTAIKGAAMSGADLEDVTSVLGAAVRTGITGAKNMNQAMGLLNATVGAGNMRLQDLAGALSTGILPAAKTAGIGLHDVGAALAMLSDEGMPAQESATRLRMTLAMMSAPTKSASKALAEIGLGSMSLGHAMQGNGGLISALSLLKAHLDSFSSDPVAQENVLVRAFGGGRSSGAIMALLNNLDILKLKYMQVGATANNFGKDVAASQQTSAYKLAKAWSNIQVDLVDLGATLAPTAVKIGDSLATIANWFDRLSPTAKRFIAVVAGGLAVGGPILLGLAAMIKAVATVKLALIGLGRTFGTIPPQARTAGVTAGENLAAGVGAGATEAETAISGVRASLLGLGALALAPIVIPIVFDEVKNGGHGKLSTAINGAFSKVGIKSHGDGSLPTWQQYQRSKGSERALWDSILKSRGLHTSDLPGSPVSSPASEAAIKAMHGLGMTSAANSSYGKYVKGATGQITLGMKAMEYVAKSFGLGVNDDYASGGHAKNSYHYLGEAADFHLVGNGMKDDKGKKFWQFLTANAGQFKELISPYGIYMNGHQVERGVNMTASKYDALLKQHSGANAHIHVAYTGGVNSAADMLAAYQQFNGKTNLTGDTLPSPKKVRSTVGLSLKGLDAEQRTNAKLIFAYATAHGLTKQQALDMVAAANAESSLRTHAQGTPLDAKSAKAAGVPVGTRAKGLFQLLSPSLVKKAQLYATQNNLVGGAFNPLAQLATMFPAYSQYYKNNPQFARGAAASAVEKSGASAAWYAAHGYTGLGLKKGGFIGSDLGTNATQVHNLHLASAASVLAFSGSYRKQLAKVEKLAPGALKSRLMKQEKEIGKGLTSGLITPAGLAALKAKLKNVDTLIKTAITKAAKGVTAAKSVFTNAVSQLGDLISKVFQDKVEAGLKKVVAKVTMPNGTTFDFNPNDTNPDQTSTLAQTPTQQLMNAHDKASQQMDDVMSLYQAYVQKYQYDAIGMPVQTQDYQDAMKAFQDAQYAQQKDGVTDSADLQTWAAENNLKIVKDADGKHLDLLDQQNNQVLQLTLSGLQDQADAEQAAAQKAYDQASLDYQSQMDLQEFYLQQTLSNLETAAANGQITADQFRTGVVDAMSAAGLSTYEFSQVAGSAFGTEFLTALGNAMTAVDNLAEAYKRLHEVQSSAPNPPISDTTNPNNVPPPYTGASAIMNSPAVEQAADTAGSFAAFSAWAQSHHIPGFAAGGIVKRRPGGILAQIGEGNYDEAIMPLSPTNLAAIAGGGSGSGGSTVVNVNVSVPGMLVGSNGMDELVEKVQDGLIRIGLRGGVVA